MGSTGWNSDREGLGEQESAEIVTNFGGS